MTAHTTEQALAAALGVQPSAARRVLEIGRGLWASGRRPRWADVATDLERDRLCRLVVGGGGGGPDIEGYLEALARLWIAAVEEEGRKPAAAVGRLGRWLLQEEKR